MAGGVNTIANLLGKVSSTNALVVTFDGGAASASVFLAGDGSAAAPAFSFTSDPTNGMYLSAADTLAWATAGVVKLTLDSSGSLTATNVVRGGALSSDAYLSVASASYMGWGSRIYLKSPADGQFNVTNNAESAGVGLDIATDAVMKVRTRAQSAYATVDALGYRASGAAGVSFGPAAVASITVVNGIITAIS